MRNRSIVVALLIGLSGCQDSSNDHSPQVAPPQPPEPETRYSAEIRRTEYGIPHIKAENWGSLGYGQGYAFAQDSYCIAMREVVFATGRSAELMGEAKGDVSGDLLWRYLLGTREDYQREVLDDTESKSYQLFAGYAAGMNRYLREVGKDNLPQGDEGCEDGSWAFEVEAVDLAMVYSRFSLSLSSGNPLLNTGISNAQPSDGAIDSPALTPSALEHAGQSLQHMSNTMAGGGKGSNAIALGRDRTQSGAGMLLGNTHQSWRGFERWHQVHLTIPGVYDVAGASPQGSPGVGLGFNRDLAWTFTTSFTNRFTLYELALNPDNPLEYRYDGGWREIESDEVSIQVLNAQGNLESRTHTFYRSHYGPILTLGHIDPLLAGWPMFNGTVISLRDANLPLNVRLADQVISMGQASDIEEFTRALVPIGNPLWHTLAADRGGAVFYGEVAAIPHVTQAQLDSCIGGIVGPFLRDSTNGAFLSLNGSDPACAWGSDPDSPSGTNLYGYEARPKLLSTDYVANSNNSYWLSNPATPLTGFPTVFGWQGYENQQQFMRTRLGHIMIEERRTATDGLSDSPGFTLDTLKGLMYSSRVLGAEIALDDVLAICDAVGEPSDGAQSRALLSCAVLADWDRRVDLESRGAQVFTEFWKIIRDELAGQFTSVVDSDEFWKIDFDPSNPINTPSGIATELPQNHERVINALNEAVLALDAANVSLDAPWGQLQSLQRNAEQVPLHGGRDEMGSYSVITANLEEGGYVNPRHGNSFINAVTWDESDCPIADVVSVYSQSSKPESDYYSDQSRLYSNKEWIRFPFCDEDIQAQQTGEMLVIEE
ncbi:MAG: penicillin acylase family protein [Halioglobus sp.]